MSNAANVPSVVKSAAVVALVLLLCSCGGKEPLHQGPLAFDVLGAVGAKTEIAGATSDSDEVMLWYENVVKLVARAVAAHFPI
jgi:hypothetical protein